MSETRQTAGAGEQLFRSEERFRLLVEAVSDYAIFMLDPTGHVASWNAGAQRIKGYRADEIIGRHFSTFYPAEDIARGKPEQELVDAAAEGRIEDEGWRIRKDGSRFWANVVITALRDRSGALRGFAKVTRDMTEQRYADSLRMLQFEAGIAFADAATLQEAAPRVLRALCADLECSGAEVWEADRDSGSLCRVSAWFAHDLDPETDRALRQREVLPAGSGIPGRAALAGHVLWVSSLAGDAGVRDEVHAAGLRSAVAVPVTASGDLMAVVVAYFGATHEPDARAEQALSGLASQMAQFIELRRADEMLRHRMREAQTLLAISLELSASIEIDDLFNGITRVAAREMRTDGASLLQVGDGGVTVVAELAGGQPRLCADRLPDAGGSAIARVIATGEVWTGSVDGDREPESLAARRGAVSSAYAPVVSGGEVIAVLAVDSTEPRRFDESDMRILQGIAAVAGVGIGNAEMLELARRRAERMSELEQAKSQFLKLASHEMRSPLTILNGYVSLIEEGGFGELTPELGRVVPLLSRTLTQMNEIVDQMLETSRLEDRRLELQREHLDLRDCVREVLTRVEPLAAVRHQLVVDLPETAVPVVADRARIETVIANLLRNAIKYSPTGGEVRCAVSIDGDDAVVRVSDRGVGIAAEDIPSLFTRFGRILNERTRHIPGTGLGLYLSRELARLHGGDITVESAPGHGSTFELRIPRDAS